MYIGKCIGCGIDVRCCDQFQGIVRCIKCGERASPEMVSFPKAREGFNKSAHMTAKQARKRKKAKRISKGKKS